MMPHGYLVVFDTTKAIKLVSADTVKLLDHHHRDEPATEFPARYVRRLLRQRRSLMRRRHRAHCRRRQTQHSTSRSRVP